MTRHALFTIPAAVALWTTALLAAAPTHRVESITADFAKTYDLDTAFYKKHTHAQGIEIISSGKVSDHAHREAAFLIDKLMGDLRPDIAERLRGGKVLYFIIGCNEESSEVPELQTKATGKDLDFYNWRHRGMLTRWHGRFVVMCAEEDLLEYQGGMHNESIFIHEFAHLVDKLGFDSVLRKRLNETFAIAKARGLWQDARAAQRFRRIKSDKPVLLIKALDDWFKDYSRSFWSKCFADQRILVNGEPAAEDVKVNREDEVLILYDKPKNAYAIKNQAEYWAEIAQAWYDTNRVHDHDHNHVNTREELIEYDPVGAALCREVFGDEAWRFVSPRQRAGRDHLVGYDPDTAPGRTEPPALKTAANDYYDQYWKPFRDRLKERYSQQTTRLRTAR